jgi:hypothetical protein
MNRTITLTAIIATATSAASAATFTDRAAFDNAAATAGVTLDNFESFESFDDDPSNFLDLIDGNGVTITGEDTFDGFNAIFTIENNIQSGLVPTDGDLVLRSSTFDGAVINFDFDNPVNAAGFDIIGAGNFGGPGEISVTTDAGESFTVFAGDNNDLNETFFAGFVSATPFSSITLSNTFDGDSFGIDAVASGIPTPATAPLLAIPAAAARRRR